MHDLSEPVIAARSWTTDAPYRETRAAIASAVERGATCVEMEAAALYALGEARGYDIVCLAHITNSMAVTADDFEKGEANGVHAELALTAHIARSLTARSGARNGMANSRWLSGPRHPQRPPRIGPPLPGPRLRHPQLGPAVRGPRTAQRLRRVRGHLAGQRLPVRPGRTPAHLLLQLRRTEHGAYSSIPDRDRTPAQLAQLAQAKRVEANSDIGPPFAGCYAPGIGRAPDNGLILGSSLPA